MQLHCLAAATACWGAPHPCTGLECLTPPALPQSTLFNALCANGKAQAENFPFCTIEPNVGVVAVPDHRLDVLVKLSNSGGWALVGHTWCTTL